MCARIALKKKSPKNKRTYRPRRIWTVQQKLHLLALASRPETSMSSIAREFDVDVRLLFQWRRDLQHGRLAERTWGEPEKRQQETVVTIATGREDDANSRFERHVLTHTRLFD